MYERSNTLRLAPRQVDLPPGLDPEAGLGAVVLQNGPGHGPNKLARWMLQLVRASREDRDPWAALPRIWP